VVPTERGVRAGRSHLGLAVRRFAVEPVDPVGCSGEVAGRVSHLVGVHAELVEAGAHEVEGVVGVVEDPQRLGGVAAAVEGVAEDRGALVGGDLAVVTTPDAQDGLVDLLPQACGLESRWSRAWNQNPGTWGNGST
jgi:hypothetical protein